MKQINPWMLLQVRPGDDTTKLKAAYRAAMLKAHPDRGGSVEAASDLNRAYGFLLDHLVDGKVPTLEQAGLPSFRQQVQSRPQPHRVPFVQIDYGSTATTSTVGSYGGWAVWVVPTVVIRTR